MNLQVARSMDNFISLGARNTDKANVEPTATLNHDDMQENASGIVQTSVRRSVFIVKVKRLAIYFKDRCLQQDLSQMIQFAPGLISTHLDEVRQQMEAGI
ncbi:unnamed protein product [Symbiodinium natans]|uniref:Uncharacterized protein n=1 Tax=Symbiodinium natans TaxID=878477 RepID=A0A812I3B9_9DINO|nr:unnamed protein product [Symbiodinium natans]